MLILIMYVDLCRLYASNLSASVCVLVSDW